MGMIVGITYDIKTDWVPGAADPVDTNAEFDRPQTIDKIIEALEAGGHTVKRIGNAQRVLEQIDDLDVDIVFNVCEGRKGRNRESEAPILLEMKGIPFVGSDALTLGLTLDKILAKRMFISEGIPTPRFFNALKTDDLKEKNTIGYPLIVKTRFEGTSKGLNENSRVEDLEGLQRQVKLVNDVYDQPAVVEEFIRGTEFTVPVVGNGNPQAMPVIQVSIDGKTDLGDEIFTFERTSGDSVQYICPARIPEKLSKQVQELAVKVYRSVECRDMGRVDFRIDEEGNPYVLEINPLPSFDERDVFNVFPQAMGSTYNDIINRILVKETLLKCY